MHQNLFYPGLESDTAVNKIKENPFLHGVYILVGTQTNNRQPLSE